MTLKRKKAGKILSTALRLHGKSTITPKAYIGPNNPLKPYVAGYTVFNTGALQDGVNHQSFRLYWKDIEPVDVTAGGSYVWDSVEAALNNLPNGVSAKIGINAGKYSPPWLMTKSGGAIDVKNLKDQVGGPCPRWWTQVVQDAWNALQIAMAAKYDSHPKLLQVIACEAMTNYMEPFILGSDPTSDAALWNAGLNAATQSTAISTMLTNTLNAWTTTRVEIPLHTSWEVPRDPLIGSSGGVLQQPWPVLRDFITPFVMQWGEKLLVSDYGLGPPPTDVVPSTVGVTLQNATTEFAWMKARAELPRGVTGAGPSGYQLTFGTGPKDYQGASQNAVDLKANYYENAAFQATTVTPADRTFYDGLLKGNASAR